MVRLVRSLVSLSVVQILSMLVLAVGSAPLAAQDLAPSGSAGWDELVEVWDGTPAGSVEERTALEAMREFLTLRLGDPAVQAYLRYWESADAEGAQTNLQVAMSGADQANIRWGRAEEMLETLAGYRQLTVDAADLEQLFANPISTDAELTTTRVEALELELDPPEAIWSGDPFQLSGVVRNLTEEYIFVAPGGLVVEVPARLLGMRGEPQFIEARFPPNLRKIPRGDTIWTALAPGTKTTVSWFQELGPSEGMKRVTSWLYKQPGDYPIRAHVGGWLGHLPSSEGPTSQDRFIRHETLEYNVHVRASMTHMLPLAWIGGLLVLLLQAVVSPSTGGAMARHGFRSFAKGLVASLVLVTVIIIMNEFAQGTPLLPTLDMTTFGAAVAAGMLIQWLGHRYYAPLISGAVGAAPAPVPTPAPSATPGGGAATPATPATWVPDSAPRSMAVGSVSPEPAPTGRAADLAEGAGAADDDGDGGADDDD